MPKPLLIKAFHLLKGEVNTYKALGTKYKDKL
jgi:hypothetical protein